MTSQLFTLILLVYFHWPDVQERELRGCVPCFRLYRASGRCGSMQPRTLFLVFMHSWVLTYQLVRGLLGEPGALVLCLPHLYS